MEICINEEGSYHCERNDGGVDENVAATTTYPIAIPTCQPGYQLNLRLQVCQGKYTCVLESTELEEYSILSPMKISLDW